MSPALCTRFSTKVIRGFLTRNAPYTENRLIQNEAEIFSVLRNSFLHIPNKQNPVYTSSKQEFYFIYIKTSDVLHRLPTQIKLTLTN